MSLSLEMISSVHCWELSSSHISAAGNTPNYSATGQTCYCVLKSIRTKAHTQQCLHISNYLHTGAHIWRNKTRSRGDRFCLKICREGREQWNECIPTSVLNVLCLLSHLSGLIWYFSLNLHSGCLSLGVAVWESVNSMFLVCYWPRKYICYFLVEMLMW